MFSSPSRSIYPSPPALCPAGRPLSTPPTGCLWLPGGFCPWRAPAGQQRGAGGPVGDVSHLAVSLEWSPPAGCMLSQWLQLLSGSSLYPVLTPQVLWGLGVVMEPPQFYQLCVHAKSLQSCLTLWPYGLWPARFLCPWDSAGKNTGVGCHALFQGIFLTQGSNPGLLHLLH